MKEVSGSCISIYMSHLYGVLKKSKMVDMVGFMDSTKTGVIGCCNPIERFRVIADRLKKAKRGQIILLPYNSGHCLLHGSIKEETNYGRVEEHRRQGIPEQKTDKDCGYFIMRYMKEITEDKNLDFLSKWERKSNAAYSQEDIDVVRTEWANFVVKTYM